MFSQISFLKILFWVGGLAFLAACKNLDWFKEGTTPPEKIMQETNVEIEVLKSFEVTSFDRVRLMEGSKNCFLDSVQCNVSEKQILIRNASFEEIVYRKEPYGTFRAKYFSIAKDWINVAPFEGETPFDLQPGQFGCNRKPLHGELFAGMVGRDNATNESMGQILTQPLEVGKLYEWGLFVCRSEKYESISRSTKKAASFCEPLILRIWGGKKEGKAEQLFAQTGPIDNLGWQKICFLLKPKSTCEAIYIEAAHSDLVSKTAYNGNILIDAVGAIREIGPTKN